MDAVIQIVAASRGGLACFRARLWINGVRIADFSPWRNQEECIRWALECARQLYGVESPTVRTGRQRV